MALSRPFVLVALAALLSAATFASLLSAQQKADASSTEPAPVVTGLPKDKAQDAAGAGSAAKPKKPAKPDPGVPPRVKRALDSGATVVLFFRQPGADDAATAAAVADIKQGRRVKVFRDGIGHLARYRLVVSSLGITQAPAVVIAGKSRKATVIEGYVDAGTLKQQVKDAR